MKQIYFFVLRLGMSSVVCCIASVALASNEHLGSELAAAVGNAIAESIEAESSEDGLRQATVRNAQSIAAREIPFSIIEVSSGEVAFLASGAAYFPTRENLTASRKGMMRAMQIAYANARRNMAICLEGVHSSFKSESTDAITSVSDAQRDQANLRRTVKEVVSQSLNALLKSFVVHQVQVESDHVVISIATSTRSQIERLTGDYMEAESLKMALGQLAIETPLLPPRGVRLVNVGRGTAAIGYGSHVAAMNDNPSIQGRLIMNAKRVATARARQSLVSFFSGENIDWSTEVREHFADAHVEFDGDPLTMETEEGWKRRDAVEDRFMTAVRSSERMSITSEGRLPPGVMVRSWWDPRLGSAMAMALYFKPLERAVTEQTSSKLARPSGTASLVGPSREFHRWPSGTDALD